MMPLVVLLLLLSIPKVWLINDTAFLQPILTIELTKAHEAPLPATEPIRTQAKDSPKLQKKPAEQPPLNQTPPDIKENTAPEAPKQPPVARQYSPQEKTLDAHDVQIMMSQAIDPKLDDADFSARSNTQKFISHQPQVVNWRDDLPYLNESIDAPRVQMQFYSAGFMGNIERFFDKVTFEKTFTTQYGTKIHCALIGVIALCGWK